MTALAAENEGYTDFVVMMDVSTFRKAQWGQIQHGRPDTVEKGDEDCEMAPNGNPSGSLFYLMIAVPTQASPVPGIPPHMYSDAHESTRSPQLNQALKKKLWVFLDRNCTNGRPLYLTGGGLFISDQPIWWKDIRSA